MHFNKKCIHFVENFVSPLLVGSREDLLGLYFKHRLAEGLDFIYRKPAACSVFFKQLQQGEGLLPRLRIMKLEVFFNIKREKVG